MKRMVRWIPVVTVGLFAVAVAFPAQAQRDVDYDWMMNSIDVLLGGFAPGFHYPLAGVDNDGNGIDEEDALAMLSSILRGNVSGRLAGLDANMVSTVYTSFNYNRSQIDSDMAVTGTNCTLLGAVGYPCQLTGILTMEGILPPGQGALLAGMLRDFMGGLATIADTPATFTFINNYIDAIIDAFKSSLDPSLAGMVDSIKGDVHLQSGNYRRHGNNGNMQNVFGPNGDVDADGTLNLAEYTAAGTNRETYLTTCRIVPALHVTTQPAAGTHYVGDVWDLSVAIAGGAAPFTFKWQDTQNFLDEDFPEHFGLFPINDGNGITGSTTQSLHFEYTTLNHNGIKPWVRCSDPVTVHNFGGTPGAIEPTDFGGRTSAFTTVNVLWRDWGIYRQPENGYVHPGGSFSTWFGVWGGFGIPTYQWYKDGSPLAGQTSKSISLTNIQAAGEGYYWCVAHNETDLESNHVFLSVRPPMQVMVNPVGGNKKAGDSHTFTVTVSGGHPPLHYQWRRANLNGAPGTGANVGPDNPAYAINSLSGGQQGSYSCIVTDASYSVSGESVTSGATNLTVLAILAQPVPQEVQPGYAAIFEILVQPGSGFTGSPPNASYEYIYQWYVQVPPAAPVPVGSAGYTQNQRTSFVIPSCLQGSYPSGSEGNYFCVVSDDAAIELASSPAPLKVVLNPITFLIQPQGDRKYTGESQTFMCIASGGTGTLSYQWTKNGVPLGSPSTTNVILEIETLELTDQGMYQCLIYDDTHTSFATAAPSSAAYLEVAEQLQIVVQPADANLYTGGSYSPQVVISGGLGTQQFQWYKGTLPMSNGAGPQGSTISGVSTERLTVANVHSGNADKYHVDVWDDRGIPRTSTFAWLGVFDPLAVTANPASSTVTRGQNASFEVATSGGIGVLHYQWRKDGVDLPSGQNQDAPIFSILETEEDDAGAYSCAVTDAGTGAVASTAGNLTVNTPFALKVQPSGADIYVGGAHEMGVTTEGGAGATYQWFFDPNGAAPRAALSGATASNYTVTDAQVADAGVYDVEVTLGPTTLRSNPALLVVAARMAISQQPQDAVVVVNKTAQFSLMVSGGLPPVAYEWQFSPDNNTWSTYPAPDSEALTLAAAQFSDEGYFRCVAKDRLDTVTSAAAHLTVNYGTPAAGPLALGLAAAALAIAGMRKARGRKN